MRLSQFDLQLIILNFSLETAFLQKIDIMMQVLWLLGQWLDISDLFAHFVHYGDTLLLVDVDFLFEVFDFFVLLYLKFGFGTFGLKLSQLFLYTDHMLAVS